MSVPHYQTPPVRYPQALAPPFGIPPGTKLTITNNVYIIPFE